MSPDFQPLIEVFGDRGQKEFDHSASIGRDIGLHRHSRVNGTHHAVDPELAALVRIRTL